MRGGVQDYSEVLKLFVIFAAISAVFATRLSTLFLVNLSDNGVTDLLESLEVLLHVVFLSFFVGSHPVGLFLECLFDGLLVISLELVLELLLVLNGVSHLVDVVLELMLGFELLLDKLVLLGELFGFLDHAVNIGFAETALIIGDSDGLDLSSSLLGGLDGKDGVLIDLESDFNLGGSAGSGRDAVDIKLTELMVILNKSAFSFENSNGNSGLLVLVSGEGLGFLGGDDGSSVDDLGHDTSNGLNTKG